MNKKDTKELMKWIEHMLSIKEDKILKEKGIYCRGF